MTAIDNWEYPPIVPGHGTIGLEIVEDCPDVEAVLVPEEAALQTWHDPMTFSYLVQIGQPDVAIAEDLL